MQLAAGSAQKASPPFADALDHFRRPQDLELRLHGSQRKSRPVEGVRRHSQPAAFFVNNPHGGPVAEGGANCGGRGMHQCLYGVRRQRVGDARPYERGGIPSRKLSGPEPTSGAAEVSEAVEPEGSPVLAAQVKGDQVPASPERHEPVGLHAPFRCFAASARVRETHHFLVPTGLRHGGEQRGVDRRPGIPDGGNGYGGEGIDSPAVWDKPSAGQSTEPYSGIATSVVIA